MLDLHEDIRLAIVLGVGCVCSEIVTDNSRRVSPIAQFAKLCDSIEVPGYVAARCDQAAILHDTGCFVCRRCSKFGQLFVTAAFNLSDALRNIGTRCTTGRLSTRINPFLDSIDEIFAKVQMLTMACDGTCISMSGVGHVLNVAGFAHVHMRFSVQSLALARTPS